MVTRDRVVVVGGGLGGLVAATLAARGGADVLLLEKARSWGGRARSDRRGEAWLNLGPHALYDGEARRVLGDLGIHPRGGVAPARGSLGMIDGRLVTLPAGPISLLMTSLFSPSEKLTTARLLGRLQAGAPAGAHGTTLADWLDAQDLPRPVRLLVEAVVRVSSYSHAPDRADAGAALDQLALGARGVRYLDGGWRTIVDGLLDAADRAGVRRRQGHVRAVAVEDGRAVGVDLDDGTRLGADVVVLAVGPHEAARLVPGSATLAGAAAAAQPVLASCLDLVVEELPRPAARLCLGLDRPLYFSVHSAVADLVAPPAAVVHVARYLAPGEEVVAATRGELETFAETVQPGLLARVRDARYLPRMTVSNALVTPGGLAARPSPRVADVGGLFVAGDWVGARGQLADAAVASAEECAMLVRDGAGAPALRAA